MNTFLMIITVMISFVYDHFDGDIDLEHDIAYETLSLCMYGVWCVRIRECVCIYRGTRVSSFSKWTGSVQGVKSPTKLGAVYALLKQTVNAFFKYAKTLIKLLHGPLLSNTNYI